MKRNGLFLYWFEEDSRNQCWIHLQDKITDVQVPTPYGSSARKCYIKVILTMSGNYYQVI